MPGEPLTQEQADALPAGTRVAVRWSGGNGPHEYEVVAPGWLGNLVDWSPIPVGPWHPLDFLGPAPPFTVAWIAGPAPRPYAAAAQAG